MSNVQYVNKKIYTHTNTVIPDKNEILQYSSLDAL